MTEQEFETVKEDIRFLKEMSDTHTQSFGVVLEAIRGLTANQKRVDEYFERLAEAQFRSEERIEKLAEAQFRSEERIEKLAEAQASTDAAVKELSTSVNQLSKTVDRYLNARLNGNSQN